MPQCLEMKHLDTVLYMESRRAIVHGKEKLTEKMISVFKILGFLNLSTDALHRFQKILSHFCLQILLLPFSLFSPIGLQFTDCFAVKLRIWVFIIWLCSYRISILFFGYFLYFQFSSEISNPAFYLLEYRRDCYLKVFV